MTELRFVRRALAGILVLGLAGLFAELLLLEHTGEKRQMIPLILIIVALLSLLWHELTGSAGSARVLKVTMWLSIIAAALGTWFHYQGNVELEREISPGASGFALFRAAMFGATPALAPGTMAMFGLIGLTYLYVAETVRRP